jgi:F-type H+-transporting ATPase subunit delta
VILGSAARRYAKALLAIGIDQNSYDAFGKELERVAESFSRAAELTRALENPVFPQERRRLILEELARRLALSKTVRNFLLLLLDKGRIGDVVDIARAYRGLVDAHAGRLRAVVTSARPLDPALEVRLKTALEKQTGRVVLLDKREDPSIIGGLTAQVGDLVYDGSVKTQLATLKAQLLSD